MPEAIKDAFSDLRISRQRKYQLRMKREQRCQICGEPGVTGTRCLKHWIQYRERERRKAGRKRRYYSALGYKLEAMAKAAAQRKRKKQSKQEQASGHKA